MGLSDTMKLKVYFSRPCYTSGTSWVSARKATRFLRSLDGKRATTTMVHALAEMGALHSKRSDSGDSLFSENQLEEIQRRVDFVRDLLDSGEITRRQAFEEIGKFDVWDSIYQMLNDEGMRKAWPDE